MGSTTFTVLAEGKNAEDAFSQAVSEARYEHGHGGYTGTIGEKGSFRYLTRTPVSEALAYELAERDLHNERSPFNDKWGDAGCIPVVTGMRRITVEGVTGLLSEQDALIRQAVTDQRLLKKGETIESTRLMGYTQAQRPMNTGYYYSSAPRPVRFTNGSAEVIIRTPKAATKRTVNATVTLKGSHSRDEAEAAIRKALDSGRNRLGAQDSITRVELEPHNRPAERTYKTTAVAPKGKTVTRYVVSGTRHDKWSNGLASQAEARAVAVAAAEQAPRAFWDGGEASFEVSAVTRREDGSPLVSVKRTLVKTVYTAEVTIVHTPDLTGVTPDAWLFFGWASC